MTATVSLVTPTYHRDFASCQLLCDSIDAFVTGFDTHYLVVSDADLSLFSRLANDRRVVLSESTLVPGAIRPLPTFLKWKGRQYYRVRGGGLPVYGWHLQQLRKLAMAVSQPSERVICIDSDNCFVRPFDVREMAGGTIVPLYTDFGIVNAERPSHVLWQRNAYRLLGAIEPPLPGDDHIGQMIVWEKASVAAILARIEAVTGLAWWQALCRARDFSEYLIYGAGVKTDAALMERHAPTTHNVCRTYWVGPALDAAGVRALIDQMDDEQAAVCVQSHTATDPSLIRSVALPA